MTRQETTDARTDAVSASLANGATAIKQTAHQRWTLELTNGSPHTASARLDDHWLCLDIPLVDMDCPSDRQLRRMLAIQAGIDGAAKLILDSDGSPSVRAEVPLTDDSDKTRRISAACESIKSALDALASSRRRSRKKAIVIDDGTQTPDAVDESACEALADLCSQSGWAPFDGPSGKPAVKIDSRLRIYNAILTPRSDAGVEIRVDIAATVGASESRLAAIAEILLRACGVVRMVKAFVCDEPDSQPAIFAVTLPGPVAQGELGEALSALAVACEVCGNEISALQNEEIAQAYLSRGRRRSPRRRAKAS
jgi:hypothetical protein